MAARFIRNHRLSDACTRWAFASLSGSHGQALRVLSNRLVGILHACLANRTTYNESTAWKRYQEEAAA